MTRKTTVLLADDHPLVRSSLARMLADTPDIEVVAEVNDADQAVDMALRLRPQVVLMDIDMPGLHSFDAARTLRLRCPASHVVFLSAFTNDRYIEEALAVEARGYLTKGETPETVIRAIRSVASGGTYFSPEIESRLVVDSNGVRLDGSTRTRSGTLTLREIEVLRYIARGMSKKEVAQTLHLSVKTVEKHCTNLMTKLDIHDRVELSRYAIREGLVEP